MRLARASAMSAENAKGAHIYFAPFTHDNLPMTHDLLTACSKQQILTLCINSSPTDGPYREDQTRRRTFRTKAETEKSKNITSTVVLSLLLIACVVSACAAPVNQ